MVKRKKTCPICRKEITIDDNPFRPFCSERCRLVDLGRWASGEYRIPSEKKTSDDGDSGKKNEAEQ